MSTKILFRVNQPEAIRQGYNAPSSTAQIELDIPSLSKEIREIIADSIQDGAMTKRICFKSGQAHFSLPPITLTNPTPAAALQALNERLESIRIINGAIERLSRKSWAEVEAKIAASPNHFVPKFEDFLVRTRALLSNDNGPSCLQLDCEDGLVWEVKKSGRAPNDLDSHPPFGKWLAQELEQPAPTRFCLLYGQCDFDGIGLSGQFRIAEHQQVVAYLKSGDLSLKHPIYHDVSLIASWDLRDRKFIAFSPDIFVPYTPGDPKSASAFEKAKEVNMPSDLLDKFNPTHGFSGLYVRQGVLYYDHFNSSDSELHANIVKENIRRAKLALEVSDSPRASEDILRACWREPYIIMAALLCIASIPALMVCPKFMTLTMLLLSAASFSVCVFALYTENFKRRSGAIAAERLGLKKYGDAPYLPIYEPGFRLAARKRAMCRR